MSVQWGYMFCCWLAVWAMTWLDAVGACLLLRLLSGGECTNMDYGVQCVVRPCFCAGALGAMGAARG
ncbi:hypothetical protein BDV23DRAFT_154340 [Aspergillus alliaceus]|uniref:Uncharacterized protein n=1 Tax=Petromyces alliaceus TaxID=209559 RepID=A0A5N7CA06_PETAA|nr:hypothetical protein BDV23DRAFT_154340 [Aspergillus alliaceus]